MAYNEDPDDVFRTRLTTTHTAKKIDMTNWKVKKNAIQAFRILNYEHEVKELLGEVKEVSTIPAAIPCEGTPQAPWKFEEPAGYYPDAVNGWISSSGPKKEGLSKDYIKEHKRTTEVEIYNWYETNYIRKGLNTPLYYYCVRSKDVRSDSDQSDGKDFYSTDADSPCYVVKPGFSKETEYQAACIHTQSNVRDQLANTYIWKVITIRNSQAPWFTCFAADQCRQECRAAFGELDSSSSSSSSSSSRRRRRSTSGDATYMSQAQTTSLIGAWYNGLQSNTSGFNGLERSILENIVKPNPRYYDKSSHFPRSTHYLYGLWNFLESNAEAPGHRDVGTYHTKGIFNLTLFDALLSVFEPKKNKFVSSLHNNSMMDCPDDQWCADPSLTSFTNIDVAKFCALPEICPVRMHHATVEQDSLENSYATLESQGVVVSVSFQSCAVLASVMSFFWLSTR